MTAVSALHENKSEKQIISYEEKKATERRQPLFLLQQTFGSLVALAPAAFSRLINPVFSGAPVKFQALLDALVQLPSSSRTNKRALGTL